MVLHFSWIQDAPRIMGTFLALNIGERQFGSAWRLPEGSIRTCPIPLGEGPKALVRLDKEVETLVAMSGATTIVLDRDPSPSVRYLHGRVRMVAERTGVSILSKIDRSRYQRTVIGYGGTDPVTIRQEAAASGRIEHTELLCDSEIAGAVLLLAAEAYDVTSAMIESVKAAADARTQEVLANIAKDVCRKPPERLFSYGEAGVPAGKRPSGSDVLSHHIVADAFDRFSDAERRAVTRGML